MEIRIDAKEIKLYVVNEFVGNIEIPTYTIKDVDDCGTRTVEIEFVDSKGIVRFIDISHIIWDTQDHLDKQLATADELAKKYDKPSGRYDVKEMCVKNILIKSNRIYVEFWWKDWIGEQRVYCSRDYRFVGYFDSTHFYANPDTPQFYY